MNRSYSKLRHIQKINEELDKKRTNSVKETNYSINEKDYYYDLLHKQRLIESQLFDNSNNFLFEQSEPTEENTEPMDPELSELVLLFPDEWKEYEKIKLQQILSSPEAQETGQVMTESILIKETTLLLEYCNLEAGIGKCIKNSKFGRWFTRKIGKPTRKFIRGLKSDIKREFQQFLRKSKGIDIEIEIKKRRKKKNLQKTWYKSKKGNIKIGRVGWINFGKGKGSASEEFDSEESLEPSIDPSEYATYLQQNDKKMVSLMSKDSKNNWEALKQNEDEDKIAYAVAVLERFNETYEEKQWKKVGVGIDERTFRQEIKNDPVINDIPGEIKEYPFQTFDFPFDMTSEPNLFKDNQWDEANATVFSQQVDTLVGQVSEVLKGLNPPEGKPKGYIKAIYLESSASRFRNGGDAEDLSFLELANKRLETARNIIVNKLNAVGVGFDATTQFNYKPEGTNGDGTSGPNPPIGFGYIPKGNYKMTPNCGANTNSCTVNNKVVNRNECGTPLANKTQYDQYKYIRGSIVIVFNDTLNKTPDVTPPDQEPTEDDPDIEIIETEEYPIYFFAPGKKPFRIPIPGIRIKWKNLFQLRTFRRKGIPPYGPPNKKPGSTKCEFFGENGK
jgi:hypothetical protein